MHSACLCLVGAISPVSITTGGAPAGTRNNGCLAATGRRKICWNSIWTVKQYTFYLIIYLLFNRVYNWALLSIFTTAAWQADVVMISIFPWDLSPWFGDVARHYTARHLDERLPKNEDHLNNQDVLKNNNIRESGDDLKI